MKSVKILFNPKLTDSECQFMAKQVETFSCVSGVDFTSPREATVRINGEKGHEYIEDELVANPNITLAV